MGKKSGIFIIIIILAFLILSSTQNWFSNIYGIGDVYCTDYTFFCCQKTIWDGYGNLANPGKVETLYRSTLTSDPNSVWCPSNAVECDVNDLQINGVGASVKIASISASCSKSFLGTSYYCDGEQSFSLSTESAFQPGTKIYRADGSSATVTIKITIYGQKLVECAGGDCALPGSGGIAVIGANGCSFSLSGFSQNEISNDAKLSGTVPVGSCFKVPESRHICGNVDEKCQSDTDCKLGHSLVYNNLGAECRGTLLEWYGCRKYNGTGTGGIWQAGTRCEVIGTKYVQCCPTAGSCGTSATCDPNTFTCKSSSQVSCTYDWECGTQTYCDRDTKTLTRDACSSGKCSKQYIRSVSCCYDSDCLNGYYCTAEHVCKQLETEKTTCPKTCCENEANYYDKPCLEGELCCADGTCRLSCDTVQIKCDYDKTCEPQIGEIKDTCSDCLEECDSLEYFDFEKQKCLPMPSPIPWEAIILGIFAFIGLYIISKIFRRGSRRR